MFVGTFMLLELKLVLEFMKEFLFGNELNGLLLFNELLNWYGEFDVTEPFLLILISDFLRLKEVG